MYSLSKGLSIDKSLAEKLYDDDGFDRVIAGDGLNAITWMAPARDLVVGTIKEEFVISSSNGKALSNTTGLTFP
jgi:hypothetical protein